MNDKVANLILEHLRSMGADMVRFADSMWTMQSEMSAMRRP